VRRGRRGVEELKGRGSMRIEAADEKRNHKS
jgi:hypothetical protein